MNIYCMECDRLIYMWSPKNVQNRWMDARIGKIHSLRTSSLPTNVKFSTFLAPKLLGMRYGSNQTWMISKSNDLNGFDRTKTPQIARNTWKSTKNCCSEASSSASMRNFQDQSIQNARQWIVEYNRFLSCTLELSFIVLMDRKHENYQI